MLTINMKWITIGKRNDERGITADTGITIDTFRINLL